jgi:hypothetical protein
MYTVEERRDFAGVTKSMVSLSLRFQKVIKLVSN